MTSGAVTALTNTRSGEVVASGIELALTRSQRRRGLLDHTSLDPATALLLAPCPAVHTLFMRFAIDVIFVDRDGCVRRIVRRLRPWRMAASRGAYATIEFAAGALESRDIVVGDQLQLETCSPTLLGEGLEGGPLSFADRVRRAGAVSAVR